MLFFFCFVLFCFVLFFTFATLWANSAADKLMIFLFFPENKFRLMQNCFVSFCMQTATGGDILHARIKSFFFFFLFWGKEPKKKSKCRLLKILYSMLSVNFISYSYFIRFLYSFIFPYISAKSFLNSTPAEIYTTNNFALRKHPYSNILKILAPTASTRRF